MTRASLSGADLYDWIALRRVNDEGVVRVGEWWLDRGHRVPGYVTDALAELYRRELVVLGDPDSTAGYMARAALTDSGSARYVVLCQVRSSRRWAEVSASSHWAFSSYDQQLPSLLGTRR